MTTVLVTKDYILADRRVLLHGLPRDRKKLIVTKNFVIFSGQNYLEDDSRKKLTVLIRSYLAGKCNDQQLIDVHGALTGGNDLFVITKDANIKIESRELKVTYGDGLCVPMHIGSGAALALTAHFAGVGAKEIIPLVSTIDWQTSENYDIVYRKDLEEKK